MLSYSFNYRRPCFPSRHLRHVRTARFLRRHLCLSILSGSHRPRNALPPSLGVGDRIGEGDSELVLDILPPDLADVAFESMRKEVAWNVMYHRGMFGRLHGHPRALMSYDFHPGGEVPRLVAVEGIVAADGR